MNNGITIIINLQGRIGESVAHTQKQSWSFSYTDKKTGRTKTETRRILHSDRKVQECYKRTTISSEVVNDWIYGKCPNFVSPKVWKVANLEQKLQLYVNRYDEGFGVKYEKI